MKTDGISRHRLNMKTSGEFDQLELKKSPAEVKNQPRRENRLMKAAENLPQLLKIHTFGRIISRFGKTFGTGERNGYFAKRGGGKRKDQNKKERKFAIYSKYS